MKIKKSVLIIAVLLFINSGSLFAAFYAKVAKIEPVNNCYLLTIDIWNDNGTPNNTTDDTMIGEIYHKWCSPISENSMINENDSIIENVEYEIIDYGNNYGEIDNNTQEVVEINETRQIKVYPNPTDGTIKVDFGKIKYEKLFLFDENGRVIPIEGDDFSNTKIFKVKLASGIYEVMAISDKEATEGIAKLIIK